jgi:pimeloyl-ACP methyl ester carboxylesterase
MPYAERDRVKVFYESFGEGAPIVFLHPLSLNRYAWVHQVFAFARSHRVVVLDHRGHGQSDKPPGGYSIKETALDTQAVLDHAGINDAILVGNSMGAMVAVQLALDAPQRVRATMLVSCATNLAPSVPAAVLEAYDARFEAAFDFMTQGATSVRTKRQRPEIAAFLADVYRAKGNFSREVFLSFIRDPDGVFNWNVTDRLKDLRQPALVVAGQEDQAMPLEAMRALAEGLPHASFKVVPDVGHYYALERPKDFNDDLCAFLDGAARAPARESAHESRFVIPEDHEP